MNVIDFDFFANNTKLEMVTAIKGSGRCAKSYLAGFWLYLVTFNRPIVSNTSLLCENDDVTLHTNIDKL